MTNLLDLTVQRYTNTLTPNLTFDELVDELIDGITDYAVVDQMDLPELIEEKHEELFETLEDEGLDVLDADTLKEAWETHREDLAPIIERKLHLIDENAVRNQIEAIYRQYVEEAMSEEEMAAQLAN